MHKQAFATFYAAVTLTLTRWPSCTNLTRIPWKYTGCASVYLLHQGFQKLYCPTYIHTDRQTYRHRSTHRCRRNYIPLRFVGGQFIYLFIYLFII